jgi:beta-N-acetylhexosaminidase
VAERSDAFAQGLQRQGVAATAKHFPGIGSLTTSTDDRLGRVVLERDEMERDLLPFRQLVDHGVAVVMLANAVYPAVDPDTPAVFSPRIVQGLLRDELGFGGVVITDDLGNTPGLAGDAGERAVKAVSAGADMVLYSPPASSPDAYRALLAAGEAGSLSRGRLEAAYRHVLALKTRLAA